MYSLYVFLILVNVILTISWLSVNIVYYVL